MACRFGMNYVPSKKWYYCWNDWDAGEIAADFDAIASLGADHLRVMLVWPWFQPNPGCVSGAHLGRLVELMELARNRGLDVWISPITGWLSGYVFLPPQVDVQGLFSDATTFDRTCSYLAAVVDVVSGFENFLGVDLGNELDVLGADVPAKIGDDWAERVVASLRPQMPAGGIVNGVAHAPWFFGKTFSLSHLVQTYDAVAIHAWPYFTSCLERGVLADPPSVHLSAFLAFLSRTLMERAGVAKPVWIQEFGCSSLWGSAGEKEGYMRNSIELAVKAGATWFTWWCSHDINRQYQFDPLEYDLGLLDIQNRPKALGNVFREITADFSSGATVLPNPLDALVDADFSPRALGSPESWQQQNLETTTWQLFDRYLETI